MSFEGGNIEREFNLEIPNLMQSKLMLRALGFEPEEGTDAQMNWINDHAENFRKLIGDNPELISRFASDEEAVLDEVEERLYKGETVNN